MMGWFTDRDDYDWPATPAEADREEAHVLGMMHPDRAWVLTDRDVWHANPFYEGPPVPHPESYQDGVEDNAKGRAGWD